jgi:hypothetical protein
MGNFLSHTRILIGFLPAGYTGDGYPLPFLERTGAVAGRCADAEKIGGVAVAADRAC